MPTAQRQSPFVDETEELNGVLSPRVLALEPALLVRGPEPPIASQAAAKGAEPNSTLDGTPHKNRGKRTEKDAHPKETYFNLQDGVLSSGDASEAELGEGEKKKIVRKKRPLEQPEAGKKKKGKHNPAKKQKTVARSGQKNADVLQEIRNLLGISASAQAKPTKSFSFGVSPPDTSQVAEQQEAKQDAAPAEEAASSTSEMETLPLQVYAGGMPCHYNEEAIRAYWRCCGKIESLDLVRFPDRTFKGRAFITFAEEAGYKAALECDGEMIGEHKIRVGTCISAGSTSKRRTEIIKAEEQTYSTQPPKVPGYNVAYVGNVAFEAPPTKLERLFAGCNVDFVQLHTDKNGKSKGFAHVHFADEESLDRAIRYDGIALMGRNIKVGYAQPKKTKK